MLCRGDMTSVCSCSSRKIVVRQSLNRSSRIECSLIIRQRVAPSFAKAKQTSVISRGMQQVIRAGGQDTYGADLGTPPDAYLVLVCFSVGSICCWLDHVTELFLT